MFEDPSNAILSKWADDMADAARQAYAKHHQKVSPLYADVMSSGIKLTILISASGCYWSSDTADAAADARASLRLSLSSDIASATSIVVAPVLASY